MSRGAADGRKAVREERYERRIELWEREGLSTEVPRVQSSGDCEREVLNMCTASYMMTIRYEKERIRAIRVRIAVVFVHVPLPVPVAVRTHAPVAVLACIVRCS